MNELKRISFEAAKAIKKAGYPQGQEEYAYRSNGDIYIFENMFDHIPDYCCDIPTCTQVWFWLWEEKGIYIDIDRTIRDGAGATIMLTNTGKVDKYIDAKNPEEAIIAAIEYLVSENLLE